MQNKLTHIYAIVFIIASYILLPMMNYDYLFAIQEHSLWLKGHTYMDETVCVRGGWITYIGCYLTQYMYYPWLGSSILIAMWVVSLYLLKKATALPDAFSFILFIPLLVLPYGVLSMGYWIYTFKNSGCTFIPTLYMLAFSIIIYLISNIFTRFGIWKETKYKIITIFPLIALISIIVNKTCLQYGQFFTTIGDENFKHELAMHNAIIEERWDDVLDEAPKIRDMEHIRPTNLMVLYKNIALMNKGTLVDSMFVYDSRGTEPNLPDGFKLSIAKQDAPLLYYRYGLINYAYRWAIENSVKLEPSVGYLKTMIRCALFNREFEVAMKYITLLKTTTFHKNWAKQQEAQLRDNAIFMQSDEFKSIFPLLDTEDELDSDDADIEGYIYGHYSNYISKNPFIEELALISSLQTMAVEEFMIHFYHYTINHPNETMPRLYQEAAIMLGPTEMSPIDVSGFKFDDIVKMQFQSFMDEYNSLRSQGKTDKDIAESMRPQYGETYWWFYYFYSDHKKY